MRRTSVLIMVAGVLVVTGACAFFASRAYQAKPQTPYTLNSVNALPAASDTNGSGAIRPASAFAGTSSNTIVQQRDGTTTYSNSELHITIQFPTVDKFTGASDYLSWFDFHFAGATPIFAIGIPRSLYGEGTYSEAEVSLQISTTSDDVANCLTAPQSDETSISNVSRTTINGIIFLSFHADDAGVGMYDHANWYKAARNGICYALITTVSYGRDSEMYVQQRATLDKELDSIIRTFRFTEE